MPFQTKSGEQIGEPENDVIRRNLPTRRLKKRCIYALLEIMLFSNWWQYQFGVFSLVDNVLANFIALTKLLVY